MLSEIADSVKSALIYIIGYGALFVFMWLCLGWPVGPHDMTDRLKIVFAVIGWILGLITGGKAPTVPYQPLLVVFSCLLIGGFLASETIRNASYAFFKGIGTKLAVLLMFTVVIPGLLVFSLAAIIPDVTRHTVSFLWALVLAIMLLYMGRNSGGSGGGHGFGDE